MKILGIIPARMAATRFPNKPLAEIQGMPMIGHCYLRSKMCSSFDEVYVATCDEAIKQYVESIGGKCVMTSDVHERATERSEEALRHIETATGKRFDVIVMIQGDEPLVDPGMIEEAIEPMMSGDTEVSNLMAQLPGQTDAENANNVKVVTDTQGFALFMSREAIPSRKKYSGPIQYYRQLGLIAFSRTALMQFVKLPSTALEIIESVDMNRFLENGIRIRMTVTKFEADSVDTPDDLARVNEKMLADKLFQLYKPVNAS